MVELDATIAAEIENLLDQSLDAYGNGDTARALRHTLDAWEALPAPKTSYPHSYYMANQCVALYIREGNLASAKQWLDILLQCNDEVAKPGEKEFLQGQLAFEQGDEATAKTYFTTANALSAGLVFQVEDPKYAAFMGVQTEIDPALYTEITTLTSAGDALMESESYEAAREKFEAALALVPAPKGNWEAGIWLYIALGDSYIMEKRYKYALDNYTEAYKSGELYNNPYINMRLGQTLFELGDEAKAKEFFLLTYRLEGASIFEDEDPKYFQLIIDEV